MNRLPLAISLVLLSQLCALCPAGQAKGDRLPTQAVADLELTVAKPTKSGPDSTKLKSQGPRDGRTASEAAEGKPIGDLWFVTIIVAAGAVGGTVNWLQVPKSDERPALAWFRLVVPGIAAAGLIPLFLRTISSTLATGLLEGDWKATDPYVFAGFCLLAGVTSRTFIQRLSDSVLRKLEDDARQTRADLAAIEAAVDEGVADDDDPADQTPPTEEEKKLLQAMVHPQFKLRSISGVAKQAGGRPKEDIRTELGKLAQRSLVKEVQGRKGARWVITSRGHRMLDE